MEECVDRNEKDSEKQWIRNVLEGHKEDYAFLVNRYKNKPEFRKPTVSVIAQAINENRPVNNREIT